VASQIWKIRSCIILYIPSPLPLAAYHQHARGGPSHGHRQYAQKLVKIARVVPEISSRIDRQTHRQTYSSQYLATAPAGEVINVYRKHITHCSVLVFSNVCFTCMKLRTGNTVMWIRMSLWKCYNTPMGIKVITLIPTRNLSNKIVVFPWVPRASRGTSDEQISNQVSVPNDKSSH